VPVSTIHVQYSDGSPGRHLRVVLGFSAGNTSPAYTDGRGEAVVDHASHGEATVYVDGRAYHRFHAPGRTAVTLR
jgi:hypothetical protein